MIAALRNHPAMSVEILQSAAKLREWLDGQQQLPFLPVAMAAPPLTSTWMMRLLVVPLLQLLFFLLLAATPHFCSAPRCAVSRTRCTWSFSVSPSTPL